MYIYPAFFYKEDDGYSVEFKDLELATCGETLEEAITMAEEALTGRVYFMLQDNEILPNPTPIEDIKKPDEVSFISPVKTDNKYLHSNKCIRKNVTIPEWLAKSAEKAGINFSAELQRAVKERLNIYS